MWAPLYRALLAFLLWSKRSSAVRQALLRLPTQNASQLLEQVGMQVTTKLGHAHDNVPRLLRNKEP